MPRLVWNAPPPALRSSARGLTWIALAALAWGCAEGPADSRTPTPTRDLSVHACEEPRPKRCRTQAEPVCAARDTGIRCVTTPCDSSEPRDYPNACEACRDPLVYSYTAGPC